MLPALHLAAFVAVPGASAPFHRWADRPPLGWNSWDTFGTTITEAQVHTQAEAMAAHLRPSGYDLLTVDIQWYEPNARGHAYTPDARLSMDSVGRLQPALNRFPSSAGGKGFKPLADFVHAKGLKFGIHIMRGIPRQAVRLNTPVAGTSVRARDIADTNSTCPWNPDMYGVDATTANGQAYYASLFRMYAEWGVDFVKVDDIARPYDAVQRAEVEAIRKAIDASGRRIVLSLSPGATPLAVGPHVMEHANMWRITDDFWDNWGLLHAMFERMDAWTPYRGPGHWPDGDMLPIGTLDFGRQTHFTRDEQVTLMSLWAMGKSPLIFGGDMTKLDPFTLRMLTNPEILGVNQQSINNRQVSRRDNLIVWTADVPDSRDKYVALFNARSITDRFDLTRPDFASQRLAGEGATQAVSVSVKGGTALVLMVSDGGDGTHLDHVAWVNPVLRGPRGTLHLTNAERLSATTGWGEIRPNLTVDGKPLTMDGRRVSGISAHAQSMLVYAIPPGYDTFSATGLVTNKGSVTFSVLVGRDRAPLNDSSAVSVTLEELGLPHRAQVRDLWARRELGVVEGALTRTLPMHGAAVFRLRGLP